MKPQEEKIKIPTPSTSSQLPTVPIDYRNPRSIVSSDPRTSPVHLPSNPVNPTANEAVPQITLSANSMAIAYPPRKYKKKILVGVASLLVIGIIAGGYILLGGFYKVGDPTNPSTWKQYTNTKAGFSAALIQRPTRKTEKSGKLHIEMFLSKSSDSQNEYSVSVFSGDSDITQSDLASFISGLPGALKNGTIQKQEKKVIDGQNATDVTFSGDYEGQQEVFMTRTVVKGNKLYEAFTIGYNNPAINSKYFLDHFKVL